MNMHLISICGDPARCGSITDNREFDMLTVIAGRNNRSDGVHLNVFDRWKTELAAVFVIGIWIIPMMFWMNNGNMASGILQKARI